MPNYERIERTFEWNGKTWRWDWGSRGRLPGFIVTNESAGSGIAGHIPGFAVTNQPPAWGGNAGRLPGFAVTNQPAPDLYQGRGDSEAEEEEEANGQARPITRVLRTMVEEDVPRRNFGDFDPVDTRKAPRHGMCHVQNVPWLEKRRVLYKGIGNKEIRDRWNSHKDRVFDTEDFNTAYSRQTNSPEEPGSYRTAKPENTEPESGFSQASSASTAGGRYEAYRFDIPPQMNFKTERINSPQRNAPPPSAGSRSAVTGRPSYSTMLQVGLQVHGPPTSSNRSSMAHDEHGFVSPRRERGVFSSTSEFPAIAPAQSFGESLTFAARTSGSRMTGQSNFRSSHHVTSPPRPPAASAAGFETNVVYRDPRNAPQVKAIVEAAESKAGIRDPTKVVRTVLDPFRVPIHREPSIILDTKPKHRIRYGVGYYYD